MTLFTFSIVGRVKILLHYPPGGAARDLTLAVPPSLPPPMPPPPPLLPSPLPPTAGGSRAARPPFLASPSAATSSLFHLPCRHPRLPPAAVEHLSCSRPRESDAILRPPAACLLSSVARQKEDAADSNDAHLVHEEEERKEGERGRRGQGAEWATHVGIGSLKNITFNLDFRLFTCCYFALYSGLVNEGQVVTIRNVCRFAFFKLIISAHTHFQMIFLAFQRACMCRKILQVEERI